MDQIPSNQTIPPASSILHRLGSFVAAHPHATAYGTAGFAAAVLILIIGFWPTLLLALLAGAGVAIGRYRDGDSRMRLVLNRLAKRFR